MTSLEVEFERFVLREILKEARTSGSDPETCKEFLGMIRLLSEVIDLPHLP